MSVCAVRAHVCNVCLCNVCVYICAYVCSVCACPCFYAVDMCAHSVYSVHTLKSVCIVCVVYVCSISFIVVLFISREVSVLGSAIYTWSE